MKVTVKQANGGSSGSVFAIFVLGGALALLLPWGVQNVKAVWDEN